MIDLRARIDAELARGEASVASSNIGRARVCARRAAGWAVRAWFERRDGPGWTGDTLKQLKRLRAEPSAPEAVRQAAERLSTQVDHEHRLPFDEDPLDDARQVVEWATGDEVTDDRPG